MPTFSFSIRTLLLMVAVVAIYFPIRDIYEPWRRRRLQVSHPIFSDFESLASITEGDSVSVVARHYPMLEAVEPNTPSWQNLARQFESSGMRVENTDEFYEYTIHGVGNFGYLQFRDGNLVNHPQEVFADPMANAIGNKSALPGLLDRMGVWPIYLPVAAAFSALCLVCDRVFRKQFASHQDNPNVAQSLNQKN